MTDASALLAGDHVHENNTGAEAKAPSPTPSRSTFGLRQQLPGETHSSLRGPLATLHLELIMHFQGLGEEFVTKRFSLARDGLALTILGGARVEFDPTSGAYVYAEGRDGEKYKLISQSIERVINCVAAFIGAQCAGSSSLDVTAAIGRLYGLPLEQVERLLIFETLRRCSGNRTRAAMKLGLSVRTIRNKLAGYSGPENTEFIRKFRADLVAREIKRSQPG